MRRVMSWDGDVMLVRDTGRRVYHPRSCGACHGAGCPIVEYVAPIPPWRQYRYRMQGGQVPEMVVYDEVCEEFNGTTHRQYLYAAMTCDLDHDHRERVYADCVPDSIVLGEN